MLIGLVFLDHGIMCGVGLCTPFKSTPPSPHLPRHLKILTNLNTTLLATMSKMHLHKGKQNNANVQLSKKRYTAKDNLDGRGGSNRRFDEASTHAGKSLIKSYTNLYIAHHDKNKGKCKRGFMQGLVEAVTKVATVLEINRDDI